MVADDGLGLARRLAEIEPIAVVAEPRLAVAPLPHEKLLASRKLAIVSTQQEHRIGGDSGSDFAVREQRRGTQGGDDLAA